MVLLGAGHANLQVLQKLAGRGVEVVLVSDGEVAVYSGMVPGVVCGEYRPEEAMVQLEPLAQLYGAEFLPIRAIRLDPGPQIVTLEDGRSVAYDVLSIDIGSRTKGTDIPGVREHCLMTRPLVALLKALEGLDRLEMAPKVVVVGAGAAGVELAFAFLRRFQAHFGPSFSLSNPLHRHYPPRLPGFHPNPHSATSPPSRYLCPALSSCSRSAPLRIAPRQRSSGVFRRDYLGRGSRASRHFAQFAYFQGWLSAGKSRVAVRGFPFCVWRG